MNKLAGIGAFVLASSSLPASAAKFVTIDFTPGTYSFPGLEPNSPHPPSDIVANGFLIRSTYLLDELELIAGRYKNADRHNAEQVIITRAYNLGRGAPIGDGRAFSLTSVRYTTLRTVAWGIVNFPAEAEFFQPTSSFQTATLLDHKPVVQENFIGLDQNAGSTGFTIDQMTFAVVPEPTSWATMIGGFGITGASMRRRRSVVRVTYI